MRQLIPAPIERYLATLNERRDSTLDAIAVEGREQQLPLIDAEVGVLLRTLATAIGARRILEIGTAIGYSGIWLAGALPPDGSLLTIDVDRNRAETARRNFERAGCADRASVIVGDASKVLHKISGPFDLIFQDGDKLLYSPMHDRLVELLRPRGLLVVDNVLWSGEVVPGFLDPPPETTDSTRAVAAYNQRVAADRRLLTSIVPLRDGVSISVKV